jgi:L-ribulose-5-phosphate 3-epimerase
MKNLDRRKFFSLSAATIAVGRVGVSARHLEGGGGGLRKGACIGVLPSGISVLERFQMAKQAGFEGIEPNTLQNQAEVGEYQEAARRTGLKILSIMNSDHWRFPLSDPDPEVARKCMDGIRTSMRNAHELGAEVVLVVPGIVTPAVRYVEVYERSQARLRELLPLARELDVVLAIENVGNRFLLSPLEFVRYVDEFESPNVKAYFDIGNIVTTGYPQDWIRTIGNRLVRVHIKRFEPGAEHPKFDPADRRTQGIDWPSVRQALREVGYQGWVTAEVKSGDENYLSDLSGRMDRFFAGGLPE